jgi:ATP-binding cassette subfamily B protein
MNEHSLPTAEERYSALSLIRRLLTEQGLVHWRKYAIAFTLMAVAAGCTAFSAYLIGDVINQAYVNRSLPGIIVIGAITVVLFSMKGLATYGHSVMLSRIGNRIIADNQRAVFSKLLNEGLGFFADRHSTEFIARLSAGAAAATQVINLLITSIGRDLLSLIGLITVMVVQDPLLSFFSFVVAPPALFVLRKLVRRIYSIARTQFHGGTRIIETLQETLQGIRIVKAFTLEDIMRERFDRNVAAVEHEANKMARVSNRASPLMETLGGCAIAIAITYGGYRVIETGATPGQFFSFITAFLLAYEPAKRLARLNIELNSALVGVRVLFEVIDSPPSEAPDGDKPGLQTTTTRLEFKDVHFAYRADEAVLRGMSFVAEAGKLTALVGPSGGGKSTVFNLLLRFYENERGLITIEVRTFRRSPAARCASILPMSARRCFCSAVRSGKTLLSGDPVPARTRSSLPPRRPMPTILSWHFRGDTRPRSANTACNCPGGRGSGSPRHARSLKMRRSSCSMSDRCADPESELQVREAMERLCEGRTTLAIAHRLHTVSHADRIYVVEDGRTVESGRHDELLRKGGRYASFYTLQLEAQEPDSPVVAVASS